MNNDWIQSQLINLPIKIGDGNYSSKYPKANELLTEGVPFISNKDIKNGKIISGGLRYLSSQKHSELKKGHIKTGDILISTRANIGDIALVDEKYDDANINAQLVFLRTDEKIIHNKYLFQLLSSDLYKKIYKKNSTGSAQAQLPNNVLLKILIKYPNFQTQQKIALILSTVDEEIQKTDQIIETTEKLKEGLVSRIFFGEKYKTIKIRDVFKTSSGGTPLVKNKEYYENGTIPWLNSGEVSQGYIYSSNKKITELGLKKSSAKIFPIDTVLVAMYGVTAGKVGILKIESSTNQAICGIYPNNDYLPEFLYQYLKTQTDFLLKQGIGAAQPNISQETIKNINIPCFSILEQKKITEILDSLDFKISEDKKSKSKLTSLKNGLMNDIFNQKVEVKN